MNGRPGTERAPGDIPLTMPVFVAQALAKRQGSAGADRGGRR